MLLSLLEQGQIRGAGHTDKDLGRALSPEQLGGFGKDPVGVEVSVLQGWAGLGQLEFLGQLRAAPEGRRDLGVLWGTPCEKRGGKLPGILIKLGSFSLVQAEISLHRGAAGSWAVPPCPQAGIPPGCPGCVQQCWLGAGVLRGTQQCHRDRKVISVGLWMVWGGEGQKPSGVLLPHVGMLSSTWSRKSKNLLGFSFLMFGRFSSIWSRKGKNLQGSSILMLGYFLSCGA